MKKEHLHTHNHHHHEHEHDHGCCSVKSEHSSCGCSHSHNAPISMEILPQSSANLAVYRVPEMDCPMEEALIRKKLDSMNGVIGMEFNLLQRIVKIGHDGKSIEEITKALESLDLGAELVKGGGEPHSHDAPIKWKKLAVAGAFALAAEIAELVHANIWVVFVFAAIAIALSGLSTYKKGWIALKNMNLNMNALMSFAVTGAGIIGHWPEAAMVMVLFTLAEVIEAKSINHAKNAIQKLLSLAPEKATVRQPDGSWADMEIKQIPLGAHIRVKPGERIAMDGKIVIGHSTVNQAPITGESLPVEKGEGDTVFAGTINESGSFEYTVTELAVNSTLSRIIYAVESAQSSKAPIQRFIDNFAKIYTPVVFVLAILIALVPPLALGMPWMEWIYKGLIVLVIACPCALVISTPISIVSGLAAATKHGILIKGGMFLEQGRKLTMIALDKTGTITHGKPVQTGFFIWGDMDENEIVTLAASLAERSDHPVSKAIAIAAKDKGITPLRVSNFAAVPGQGTKGDINGKTWYLGNHRMVEKLNSCSTELELKLTELESEGKTVVMLIKEKGVQALFAVSDTVKESSIEAIEQLKKLGLQTVILTGDNKHTANAVAKAVNADKVYGNLLPEDKLSLVEEMSKTQHVGMVGDGINDAPALAKADIGFAMGAAGTDTAIETADVALMDDDLRKIPVFIKLSKATRAILTQNITTALGIKVLFFGLTFVGETTMWMAVFADIGTSLLVIANSLRLLRK